MPMESTSSSPEVQATQYVSDPDDAELFEVIEILDERGGKGTGDYLVQWGGIDPATRRPWEPSWAAKNGCTTGLIEEWRAKKKANPEIVGVERKKFEEKEAARRQAQLEIALVKKEKKETAKRKRETKSKSKGATAKRSRIASRSRPPNSKGTVQEQSVTPSDSSGYPHTRNDRQTTIGTTSASISPSRIKKSPESDFVVPAPVSAPRTTRSRARDTVASASASVEPVEHPPLPASPLVERSKRTINRKPISLKPASAIAGPGPSTIENRSKDAAMTREKSTGIQSPEAVEAAQTNQINVNASATKTQTTRSILDSQTDPITQFSSPLRFTRDRRDENLDNNKNDDDDDLSPLPDETPQVFQVVDSREANTETMDVDTTPARFERRIIDGEEVLVAVSESLDDDDDEPVVEAMTSPVGAAVDSANVGEPDPDLGEQNSDDHTCCWNKCGANFTTAVDLAHHLRIHVPALEPVPINSVSVRIGEPTRPSTFAQSVEVAELREEIERLQTQLQLDEVGGLRAEIVESEKKLQSATQKAEQFSANITELVTQVEEIGPLRTRASNLSNQLQEMETLRTDLRDSQSKLQERVQDVEKLRSDLDDTQRKLKEVEARSAEVVEFQQQLREAAKIRETMQAETEKLTTQIKESEKSNETVQKLESDVRALKKSKKSIEDQSTYISKMYQEASSRASEETILNNGLRDQIKVLKSQLSEGLKQRDLHREAVSKRREDELRQLKAQNKILSDQARLTDDTVRRKAAQYHRLVEDKESLTEIIRQAEARNLALVSRNDELIARYEEMRAREMGLLDGDEDSEDDDYGSETSSRSSMAPSPRAPAANKRQLRSTRLSNISTISTFGNAVTLDNQARKVHDENGIFPAGEQYPCKWTGEVPCKAVFDTVEQVTEHVRLHQEFDITTGEKPRYESRSTKV